MSFKMGFLFVAFCFLFYVLEVICLANRNRLCNFRMGLKMNIYVKLILNLCKWFMGAAVLRCFCLAVLVDILFSEAKPVRLDGIMGNISLRLS